MHVTITGYEHSWLSTPRSGPSWGRQIELIFGHTPSPRCPRVTLNVPGGGGGEAVNPKSDIQPGQYQNSLKVRNGLHTRHFPLCPACRVCTESCRSRLRLWSLTSDPPTTLSFRSRSQAFSGLQSPNRRVMARVLRGPVYLCLISVCAFANSLFSGYFVTKLCVKFINVKRDVRSRLYNLAA